MKLQAFFLKRETMQSLRQPFYLFVSKKHKCQKCFGEWGAGNCLRWLWNADPCSWSPVSEYRSVRDVCYYPGGMHSNTPPGSLASRCCL